MKKSKIPLIIIGVVVVSFALLGILTNLNSGEDIESKTVSEWLTDTSSGKGVVTVIGLTTCSHCQEYKPKIISLARKKGFNLYFFEVDTLSQEDRDTLLNTYELADYTEQVPFTYIINDNSYVDGMVGFSDINEVKDFLTKNKILEN